MFADRVYETSTSTGTGSFTLGGAVTGYRSFSTAFGTSAAYYLIVNRAQPSEWEIGSFTVSGTTLARTAGNVLSGSAGAGTLVSFSAGTKDVYNIAPAATLANKAGDTLTGGLTGTSYKSSGTTSATGFQIGNGTDLASLFSKVGTSYYSSSGANRVATATGTGPGVYRTYSLETGASATQVRLVETTVNYTISYCSYCGYCGYCTNNCANCNNCNNCNTGNCGNCNCQCNCNCSGY